MSPNRWTPETIRDHQLLSMPPNGYRDVTERLRWICPMCRLRVATPADLWPHIEVVHGLVWQRSGRDGVAATWRRVNGAG